MRILKLLVLVAVLLPGMPAEAKNYSCRDSQGQMHFSDRLENLPEDCRAQAQELSTGAVDNLIYVPAQPAPSGSGIRFEHSVRDAEQQQQRKKQLGSQLLERAELLAAKFTTASTEKHRARRNWKYSSRAIIQQADESIQQAWEGKQQLLQELSNAALSSETEQQIRALVEPITEK